MQQRLKMVKIMTRDFYSHTPCGVQPENRPFIFTGKTFLLTHPLRGATEILPKSCRIPKFLLTHPLRGATSECLYPLFWIFISTHTPLAGCNAKQVLEHCSTWISTHTPLAGCNYLFT